MRKVLFIATFRKILLFFLGMKKKQSIEKWVEYQLSLGKYGFSLGTLREEFPERSATALKFSLKRLSDKKKILSIYKGYYLIIPPQYAGKGILPPVLFVDDLMDYLQRPYYLGLLTAAAFHGAAHQRPQETFVMTVLPPLRTTMKKGIRIHYISIRRIPEELLEKRKTETGYINISNPALTATDLIQFEKRAGGLMRVTTVLDELAETLAPASFNRTLLRHAPVKTLQRLGYLLEFICQKKELADTLFKEMMELNLRLYRTPLKASGKTKGFSSRNRWKVIVNTEIETDL